MELMNDRQRIINNITNITDNNGNKILLANGGIRIEFKNNKYSAKKLAIWHIYVNGKRISKSDNYIFEYNCVSCHSRLMLSPISLIRKVNKCAITCVECMRQSSPGKNVPWSRNFNYTSHHTDNPEFYTPSGCNKNWDYAVQHLTYLEKRDTATRSFDALDDDYKSAYFKIHLTQSDYERISKNIVGFENGKITDFENIEYWPIYNSTTQLSFTHIMYNTKTQTIFKPHQPIMKCDHCNKHWRAASLEKFKNHYRIYCPQCQNNTCNTTFRYRNTYNINNSSVLYCSLQEWKFIEWCNNNGIVVNNGPIISYEFAGQVKTYRIGFLIYNTLIDTKDNIWQREEYPGTNWQAKESAARAFVASGTYDDYIIITPKNWITNIKHLKAKFAAFISAAN